MDREKLKELIMDIGEIASAVGMQEWVVEKIADHLIANGIGDITAEKHRVDVAEEALKMACREVATINYGTLAFKINIIDTIVQDAMKKCKQQAEERLKEKK